MADTAQRETQLQRPAQFLNGILGKKVAVKLASGVVYEGIMVCLDGFMNVVLQDTTEVVEGKHIQTFGDAFIRGNNVMYISAV